MKKATLIAIVVTLSTFMFANVNITWGNSYSTDANNNITSTPSFGVWFDVNDATSVGWENGIKVGLAGPADTSLRLGYENGTSLGIGWNYDFGGGGTGWGTTLGTSIDFQLTNTDDTTPVGALDGIADDGQGDFTININLGLGF